MSVVSPWGFGINRAEIEFLVIELTMLATGLAANRVLIDDQKARTSQPARPWCSIFIGSPVGPKSTGADERIFPALEEWLVTVTDDADDTYTITVLGTPYDFVASGDTTTDIRDGLLTAIGTPTGWTATAVGTAQIQIDSTVEGQRLFPATAPATMTLALVNGNLETWELEGLEIAVNISCKAFIDIENPLAVQNGPSMADLVEMFFNSRAFTEKMRDCGHVPLTIRRLDAPGLLNQQQQSESIVQIVLATTGRLVWRGASIVEAPVAPVVNQ